jgi:hypothetical protein
MALVDEELRRELLARREEDQRIRHLAAAQADPDTPIADPAQLDERRAQIGLEPFADYEARLRTDDEDRQRQGDAAIPECPIASDDGGNE